MNDGDLFAGPAIERASQAMIDAILDDPYAYPDRTSFLGADHPRFGDVFAEVIEEGKAVVVVMPDDQQVLYEPRADVRGRIRRRTGRRRFVTRMRGTGALVPAPDAWFNVRVTDVPGYATRLVGRPRQGAPA